jgi:hypothetical protein
LTGACLPLRLGVMNPTRCFALAATTLTFFTIAASQSLAREYYELRTYRLKSEAKAAAFDKTFGPAIVEAMEAAAVGPIGIFKPTESKDTDKGEVLRYVLAPYKSIEEWAGISDRLKENGAIWEPALEFLMASKADTNYSRIDSMLLVAFDGMPKLKLPAKPKDADARHFEIRTYESHSIVKGALKVEMFNEGELDIFKKTGLDAVFFGEAKIAKDLPQLTYMLVYDSEEARKKAWAAFLAHPDWLKLKENGRYKDTVSKIHSSFVKATEYSQIK